MKTVVTKIARENRNFRPAWALLFLALFLTLQLFAGSGTLHQAIHSDANAPDHHCAITLLTQGQVNVAVVMSLWLAFAIAFIFSLPLLEETVQSFLDLRLAPGRAPPLR
jgi:hypothetical protein